jgi:hypothetical protein
MTQHALEPGPGEPGDRRLSPVRRRQHPPGRAVQRPRRSRMVSCQMILVIGMGLLLALAPWLAAPAAGEADRVSTRPDVLPLVTVRVVNASHQTLSLSIPSAPCTPRVILHPAEAATLDSCLRQGVVYQAVAVFYDRHEVHARRYRLVVASPGADWVFQP